MSSSSSSVCRSLRLGLVSFVPIVLLFPFATLIARQSLMASYVYLTAVTCLRTFSANFAFNSSMVMVNVAAPKAHVGAINGVGQTLASFVRGMGPALAGALWSLSVATGLHDSQFIVFAIVAALAAAGNALYCFLPGQGQ